MAIYIGGPQGLTWAAARDKVRGDLWRPGNSLSDDVVNRALHASVLELEAEATWLWLEEVTATATVDADTAFLDLPLTIGHVTALSVRRDGWLERIEQLTIAPVREAAAGATGDPTWWAWGNSRIWFDCAVRAGLELEMVVKTATPEVLEVALETNSATMQRQQQAVIANACSHVALNFMKNEAEGARQRAVYERILERLLNTEADRRGGAIQPDTWGMGRG